MSKISKNIKQFRKQKGLTQEALAEMMNVTRQAISNWENDKTQPDIDSLEKLSSVFGVKIEEMIYGKDKFIQDENDKSKKKNIMKVLLSVFGSLFIGTGLVLLFVFFWRDFPLTVKTIFCILPVIAGQLFAVFVFIKKKDFTIWNESAAVIWCVGIISTIALIDNVYNINFGYERCLLIDALLCLPSIFVFNSVAPIIPYFYMVLSYAASSDYIALGLILMCLGGLYVLLNRKDIHKPKIKFALWIFVFSSVWFIFSSSWSFETSGITILIAMLTFLFSVSGKKPDYSMPFYIPGILGTAVSSVIFSNLDMIKSVCYYSDEKELTKIVVLIISALIFASGIIIGRKSYKNNTIKALITASSGLLIVMLFVWNFFVKTNSSFFMDYSIPLNTRLEEIYEIIPFIPASAIGILFIIDGVNEIKLLDVNVGIIVLFSIIVQITLHFSDVNILMLSLVLILFGGVLITVNTLLSKKKKDILTSVGEIEEAE